MSAAHPIPPALVAGPLTDTLVKARNALTHALREVEPLNPGMEPSAAQLDAIAKQVISATATLTPVLTALHSEFASEGVRQANGGGHG